MSEKDRHDRDRDNESGRYVSDEYAKENPDITTSESTSDKKGGEQERYRDDKTGRFVRKDYAQEHPDSTGVDHV